MRTRRSQTISEPAPKSRCCRAASAPRSAMVTMKPPYLSVCPEQAGNVAAAQCPGLYGQRAQREHDDDRGGQAERERVRLELDRGAGAGEGGQVDGRADHPG